MGNQGHAGDGIRVIQEWIDGGVIGDIQHVYHWSNRPIWPQGDFDRPAKEEIPAHLNYDLWCGTAPVKPYSARVLPFRWRGFWDYGSGAIGDMACHIMDASYTGLGLSLPKRIEASSSPFSQTAFPQESTIEFVFPRAGKPDVQVTWMDGGRRPRDVPHIDNAFIHGEEGNENAKGMENGTLIVGSKGALSTDTYCGQPRLFPRDYYVELAKGDALPAKTLPRVGGHFEEWFDGIRANQQPGANFDYAADFTETALLGTVAIGAGAPIEYDAANMKVTNHPEANALLDTRYDYREEFLPG